MYIKKNMSRFVVSALISVSSYISTPHTTAWAVSSAANNADLYPQTVTLMNMAYDNKTKCIVETLFVYNETVTENIPVPPNIASAAAHVQDQTAFVFDELYTAYQVLHLTNRLDQLENTYNVEYPNFEPLLSDSFRMTFDHLLAQAQTIYNAKEKMWASMTMTQKESLYDTHSAALQDTPRLIEQDGSLVNLSALQTTNTAPTTAQNTVAPGTSSAVRIALVILVLCGLGSLLFYAWRKRR